MSTTVKQRFIHATARKLRLVAGVVRGKPAETALQTLAVTPKAAAKPVMHAVKSALASAKRDNPNGQFIISAIFIDEGPALKRRILHSRGRASRMEHRMSHITLTLEPTDTKAEVKKKSKKRK